ncbi:cytosolic protein [Pelagibius marinus]|uniref:cytosolic protein n=1 Tax=Pelagibius marinus TaxID=2762760 RepID=UPI0018723B05|nr:cytosolic protein [Pelagibius marinus]
MKCFMLFTGSGPLVILTSYGSATDDDLLEKLRTKGIDKFLAYEISIPLAQERYGAHFGAVKRDLHQEDDLRILDYNGERAFRLFHFRELASPITYEVQPQETAQRA